MSGDHDVSMTIGEKEMSAHKIIGGRKLSDEWTHGGEVNYIFMGASVGLGVAGIQPETTVRSGMNIIDWVEI